MTPESAARDWMDSGEYERLARQFAQPELTIEEYTRGDPPRSMSVGRMHALFEAIFVAGATWGLKQR